MSSYKDVIASTYSVDVANVTRTRVLDGSQPDDQFRSDRYRNAVSVTVDAAPRLLGITAALSDGQVVEYLAYDGTSAPDACAPSALKLIVSRCDITYEDLSPSQCVEYSFADEDPVPTWHLSRISKDGYDHFIQCKFKVWEKALREPTCEAAFRRMLQRGLVYQMYDSNMFPTPPQLVEKYKVIDETNGKAVELPHPVSRCRTWDAELQTYTEVDTKLAGAPQNEEEAKTYWNAFLQELKDAKGAEYIDNMLSGKSA